MLIALNALATSFPPEPPRAVSQVWRPGAGEVRHRFEVPGDMDEVVVSWNADLGPGESLSVVAHPEFADGTTGRYDLGRWSTERDGPNARTSVNGQDDDGAKVDTDILVLKKPAPVIWLEIVSGGDRKARAKVRRVVVSFSDSRRGPASVAAPEIKPLNVPQKAQRNYANGGVICSPTCVSMVLAYWADQRKRPDWSVDVPAVADGVFDPGWNGTGNWSFNAAFAGSLPGMGAEAVRMNSLEDLFADLRRGIPVVASVSYALLKGRPSREPNDGHLVVVVGAKAGGELIFNDPGLREVRTTYPLDAFVRAWSASGGTVYRIAPEEVLYGRGETGAAGRLGSR